MANELNILLDTGLTITGKVYSTAGVQQGTNVTMTEVATSQYSGTFAVATLADGQFPVHFYDGATLVGSGLLEIKDGAEIIAATQTSVDAVQTDVTAIKAKTDNLPASPAAVSDIPTAVQNADAVWAKTI